MKNPLIKQLKNTPFLVCLILSSCIENSEDPIPGADGLNAMIEVIAESAGSNCPEGGIRIIAGQDSNENGQLDASEIISTTFVCNASATKLLAQHTTEAPGTNCTEGGSLIEMGNDANENGTLETEEIEISYYVCNGSEGTSSLMVATEEGAGANCAAGGIKLEIGSDENGDGLLNTEEIASTSFICHGVDGANGVNSLMLIEAEAAGSNCGSGGLAIHVGLDTDGNGTLEDTEYVGATQYVCNGNEGKSPIMISQTDTSCPNGGMQLTFGFDEDGDGALVDGTDTILETLTLCHGEDGLNSLITTTTLGTSCTNGGVLFELGLDENGNNILDTGEITASHSICNGDDGLLSLINLTPLSVGSASCINGGVLIEVGTDINGNNTLDPGEVNTDQTTFVCNGSSDGIHEFYFTQGLDGYSDLIECSMSNYPTALNIDSLIVGYLPGAVVGQVAAGRSNAVALPSAYSFFPLLRFNGMESIADKFTGDYQVVEATLFVYGSLYASYSGNRMGINHLLYPSDGILFGTDATIAQRTATPSIVTWINGDFSEDDQSNTFDMYNMLQRGTSDTTFVGYVPLSLDRSYVDEWIAGKNHGVVLSLVDDTIEGNEIMFIRNSNDPNVYLRPTLYIKVKEVSTPTGRITKNEKEHQDWWQSLSYEEKIAPIMRRQ